MALRLHPLRGCYHHLRPRKQALHFALTLTTAENGSDAPCSPDVLPIWAQNRGETSEAAGPQWSSRLPRQINTAGTFSPAGVSCSEFPGGCVNSWSRYPLCNRYHSSAVA